MNRAFLLLLGVILSSNLLAAEENPFSLDDCISYAIEHAPDLRRDQLSHTNATYSVLGAKTKFDPVFRVSNEYRDPIGDNRIVGSVNQTLPMDFQLRGQAQRDIVNDDVDVSTYSIRLSKTLLGGGSKLESELPVRQAELDEAIAWNNYNRELRRIKFTVARDYYAVIRNKQTLRMRQLQLERARHNLKLAIAKEEPLDIATAQLGIPENELRVLSARQSITNSVLRLKETIGMPMKSDIFLATNVVYATREIDGKADLHWALENNEDLLNARLSLKKSELDARVAQTKRLPELNASVSAVEQDFQDDTDLRGEVSLTWPWMDRKDRIDSDQADVRVQDRKLAILQTKQSKTRTIMDMTLRLAVAEKSVGLQEERVKVLERQFELYNDRWLNGDIDILEFIRSENNLEDARVSLLNAKAAYLELLAEYEFEVGR